MSSPGSPLPARIGLTSYREQAAWGVWDQPADLLPATYSASVLQAGGAPVLLPSPGPGGPRSVEALAEAVLNGLDGLLLTGGSDVDPAQYGAERGPHTDEPRPERDAWELTLARLAVARGLPTLCICRGMQTLNVALGGTLIQHLPDQVGHESHSPTVGQHGRHLVQTAPGTRIAGALGDQTEVASYHHQAVDVLADGLIATAWADDRTIEAAEGSGPSWLLAVQWHPEVHNGERLFADFVAACAQPSHSRV